MSCAALVPLALATQMSSVSSPGWIVNAIREPSGDQSGCSSVPLGTPMNAKWAPVPSERISSTP